MTPVFSCLFAHFRFFRKRGPYEEKWFKILGYGYSIAILNMIENLTLKEGRLTTAPHPPNCIYCSFRFELGKEKQNNQQAN